MNTEVLEQLKTSYNAQRQMAELEPKKEELTRNVEAAEQIWLTLTEELARRERSLVTRLKIRMGQTVPDLEELRADVTCAQQRLELAKAQLEACNKIRTQAMSRFMRAPSLTILKRRAKEDPETARAFALMEIRFCAEKVLPLLEKNYRAWEEYLTIIPQGVILEGVVQSEYNRIYDAVLKAPEACLPLLDRIREAAEILKEPFTVRYYFQDSKAFMRDHTKGLDNKKAEIAMPQIETQKSDIQHLLNWINRKYPGF